LADIEVELRAFRRELQSRQRADRSARPVPVWWVQTKGETTGGYYSESLYPEQDVDNPTCELPAVYLDAEVPDPNTDPVIWTPRSEQPQITLVSPGGWIPEGIRLGVFRHHDDRIHVLVVPVLRVVANETIAPDQHGQCSLWLAGVDTEIDFACWNDWLDGGNSIEAGKQCLARLDDDLRHWSVSAGVEC
jgi:hypothetical protein